MGLDIKGSWQKRSIAIKAVINELRPPQPPCFHDLLSWHEYLASAVDTQMSRNGREEGPLASTGKTLSKTQLSTSWTPCKDCEFSDQERAQMQREGRCDPGHWARNVEARRG